MSHYARLLLTKGHYTRGTQPTSHSHASEMERSKRTLDTSLYVLPYSTHRLTPHTASLHTPPHSTHLAPHGASLHSPPNSTHGLTPHTASLHTPPHSTHRLTPLTASLHTPPHSTHRLTPHTKQQEVSECILQCMQVYIHTTPPPPPPPQCKLQCVHKLFVYALIGSHTLKPYQTLPPCMMVSGRHTLTAFIVQQVVGPTRHPSLHSQCL